MAAIGFKNAIRLIYGEELKSPVVSGSLRAGEVVLFLRFLLCGCFVYSMYALWPSDLF